MYFQYTAYQYFKYIQQLIQHYYTAETTVVKFRSKRAHLAVYIARVLLA